MTKKGKEKELVDFQKGYVTLPFNENNFKQFITGLLGTPQTIKKRIKGIFELHLKDLQNFHDLLDQRISQQNNGKLIQLKAEIYFNDSSSVILSSYEELVSYNEVKPIISEAIRLTWTYLIQFTDKPAPEKQQIEIMIISTPEPNVVEDNDIPILYPTLGQFRINIEHTARTWGSDIENLLSNQINSILKSQNKWKNYCKKNNIKIGIFSGFLFLIINMSFIYYGIKKFSNEQISAVNKFTANNSEISSKIDYLLNYVALNVQENYYFKSQIFTVFTVLLAIIISVIISRFADLKEKSFLVLTRGAKTNLDKQKKKAERKVIWFFVSVCLSIIVGIIANYLFMYLTE